MSYASYNEIMFRYKIIFFLLAFIVLPQRILAVSPHGSNLIPDMTSSNTPAGSTIGSPFNGMPEYDIWHMFDRDSLTMGYQACCSVNWKTGYIFTEPKTITVMKIWWFVNQYGTYRPEYDNFIIEGSNDGSNWVTIYDSVNIPDTTVPIEFDITTPGSYTHYQFTAVSNYGIAEWEMYEAPPPTPTPTITPTPTPVPPIAPDPAGTITGCPAYYDVVNRYGVDYCSQTFGNVSFLANDPLVGNCVTYTVASIAGNGTVTCGDTTLSNGSSFYSALAGFSYHGNEEWLQPVYPSEITKLLFSLNIQGGTNSDCRPYFIDKYGDWYLAGVDQNGGNPLGAYGRAWNLDQDVFTQVQPVGIAVECDDTSNKGILSYNYHHDPVYDRASYFSRLEFEYPAYATLAEENNWEASQSSNLRPVDDLDLSDCGIDVICSIQKAGQWAVDWMKNKIEDMVSAWLNGIKLLFTPTVSLTKLTALQTSINTKTPWAYLNAFGNMDLTDPEIVTANIIPDFHISALYIKIRDGATIQLVPEITLTGSTFQELNPAVEALRLALQIFIIGVWAVGIAFLVMEGIK